MVNKVDGVVSGSRPLLRMGDVGSGVTTREGLFECSTGVTKVGGFR